jgi:NIPSNAP
MTFNRRDILAATAAGFIAPPARAAKTQRPNPMDELQSFELRQYTLRGQQRDTLIALFESRFIEPQEELGAHVIGTFRDMDDPDRFVWIRGFRDLAARQASLTAFYGGPVWQAHRTAANSTMLDSDNVLLLKPTRGQSRGINAQGQLAAIYGARIFALGSVEEEAFATMFFDKIKPHFDRLGAVSVATFVSESAPNSFPALPVRSERVFVWVGCWTSPAAEQRFEDHWRSLSGWRDTVAETLLPALMRKPERLRLTPTQRSAL